MDQLLKIRFLKGTPHEIEKNEGHDNYLVKWKDPETR
jgi:hypothetical protein